MSLHIVMTGYDSTVFQQDSNSDTRIRLQNYAYLINKQIPGSKITYINLRSPLGLEKFHEKGVDFIPLQGSLFLMPLRLLNLLYCIKPISFIFTQTPYEDGFIALIFLFMCRIPFGVQVHNDLAFTPGGALSPFRKLFAMLCFSHARFIRVVNPIIAKELHEKYGDTVQNLPVASSFSSRELIRSVLPSEPIILVVSRLSKEKGIDIALEVMSLVQKQIPSARLIIAGEGDERKKLEDHAKSLMINVDFRGSMPSEDLVNLYRKSTLLLLTSLQEGWGRVLIEAGMSSLPVVATRTKGSAVIVKHAETGYLHDHTDILGLSQSIIKLCKDTELNIKMGQENLKFSKKYDPEVLTKNLIDSLIKASVEKK